MMDHVQRKPTVLKIHAHTQRLDEEGRWMVEKLRMRKRESDVHMQERIPI